MGRLDNKRVVITGGAGGIGAETAKLFLKEGAKVALVDLDQDALNNVADTLEEHGKVVVIAADVSDEADVERYVQEAKDKLGGIDVFFNNAGIEGTVAPLIEQKVEDFDKVMAVNVRGMFLGLKHVMKAMSESGGSIINTSSVAGLSAGPGLTPYVASKHAVVGLTRNGSAEGAGQNIRVNSVHPAPVNTRMMRSIEKGSNPEDAAAAKTEYEKWVPLGRYGEPNDVAQLVLFLASDESNFITGAQYVVDGGMTT